MQRNDAPYTDPSTQSFVQDDEIRTVDRMLNLSFAFPDEQSVGDAPPPIDQVVANGRGVVDVEGYVVRASTFVYLRESAGVAAFARFGTSIFR